MPPPSHAGRSTLALPPSLRRQLETWRTTLWRRRIAEWACLVTAAAAVYFLAVWLLDRLWDTPARGRLTAWSFLAGVSVLSGGWFARRWWFRFRDRFRIGHFLRRWDRRVGDQVLAALELTHPNANAETERDSRKLREAAVAQLAEKLRETPLEPAIDHRPLQRASTSAAGLVLLSGLLLLLAPHAGLSSARRAFQPWLAVDRYTFTQLAPLPPSLVVPHGEPTALAVSLDPQARWKTKHATARLPRSGIRLRTPLDSDGHYTFELPGLLENQALEIRAGDARHRMEIHPKHRPGLESLGAAITLPAYLKSPDQTVEVEGGLLETVFGAEVVLSGTVNRPLTQAELRLATQESLAISGSSFSTDALTIGEPPQVAEFHWRDQWGLAPAEPLRLRLVGRPDQPPTVSLLKDFGGLPAILPNDTLPLALRAEDDFGVQSLGYVWGNADDEPQTLWKSRGMIVKTGEPQDAVLDADLVFSPSSHGLPPGRWQLWAFALDLRPGAEPSFSSPLTLQVLTEEQHAALVRAQFRQIQEELESVARREADLKQRNETLAAAPALDPAALAGQGQAEEQAAEDLERLAEQTSALLGQAMKNASLDNQAMRSWGAMLGAMQSVAREGMPQAAQSLGAAQSAAARGAQAEGQSALQEAIRQQEENLEQLAEAMSDGQQTEEALEAATFVTRLRQAATAEEQVATTMRGSVFESAGLTADQLDTESAAVLFDLTTNHETTRQEVGYLMNDLKHYHRRTQKVVFGDIHEQMLASNIPAELTEVTARVERNQHGRVIAKSLWLANQFHAWADALGEGKEADEARPPKEGSGESPGEANTELMLAIMRLVQREMALRDQTRAADRLAHEEPAYARAAQQLAADQRAIVHSVAGLLAQLMGPELQLRLRAAAKAMDDAVNLLNIPATGGETIAAETEAIERLAEAAKASGQMGGESKTVQAFAELLAMMEIGNSPGGNASGDSSTLAIAAARGAATQDGREQRTVERSGGQVGGDFPEEFREALGHFFEQREKLRTPPSAP